MEEIGQLVEINPSPLVNPGQDPYGGLLAARAPKQGICGLQMLG
jgi:hypothetical protein